MTNILLVAVGGAFGASCRYLLSLAFGVRSDGWPWSTVTINVAGSFLIGVLSGWLLVRGEEGETWRLLLGTGCLGGFTTFSAFSADTLRLIERGETAAAGAYALGSVLAGLLAVWVGMTIMRRVAP